MRCYIYHTMGSDCLPATVLISEGMILKEYYSSWCEKVKRAGREDLISEENCIDHFIVVNWAYYIGDF